MKIIIGFESLEASDYIFADLKAAGLPADAEFTIISATDMEPVAPAEQEAFTEMLDPQNAVWQREISPDERAYLEAMLKNARQTSEEKTRELSEREEHAADTLRILFPSATVKTSVQMGSPYGAITSQAAAQDADLIVVGSQNASALTRFFLGSVSQKVVTQSDRSVRIARAHRTPTSQQPRIIVGYDGSVDSDHAIAEVARRSWPPGTQVKVVVVAEQKSVGSMLLRRSLWSQSSTGGVADVASESLVKGLAEAAAGRLREAGINADAIGVVGDPKNAISTMAEEWQADSIFIGAKGHRASLTESLGAVAYVLSTRAHCSVEVVRYRQPLA